MPLPVWFRHPSSLEHDNGPHPESPARIIAIESALTELPGWERRDSPAVARATLERVHPAGYVQAIEDFCAAGGGAIDMDTLVSRGSFSAAEHGAGGAVAVVDAVLADDGPQVAASVHRPPGHHAEAARAMGFCLFNNVAVAAQHALDAHGLQRVFILDWDVHHGNGTNDIFHARRDVFFCSIHQWPLYPGTGAQSDRGQGEGEGFTLNLPVAEGSGDAIFCDLIDETVVPAIRAYGPGLILLSAGFDAHADDPLAGCEVTDAGYRRMAASVRGVAEELGVAIGVVLEGGYNVEALARSFAGVLAELG